MSCVTEMTIIGYRATSLVLCSRAVVLATGKHVERTDTQDCAQYMDDCFSASLLCNSKRMFSVAPCNDETKPFSNERRPYLLVDVKSSAAALH